MNTPNWRCLAFPKSYRLCHHNKAAAAVTFAICFSIALILATKGAQTLGVAVRTEKPELLSAPLNLTAPYQSRRSRFCVATSSMHYGFSHSAVTSQQRFAKGDTLAGTGDPRGLGFQPRMMRDADPAVWNPAEYICSVHRGKQENSRSTATAGRRSEGRQRDLLAELDARGLSGEERERT